MAFPYDSDKPGVPYGGRSKDPDSPATTSAAWDIMAPRWAMIDAVLGGTETMRAAGEQWLPRHPAESPGSYTTRLGRATLNNYLEHTISHLAGRAFVEDIKVLDDVPDEIKELLDDVDLQGNELETFASRWFHASLSKGFSHCLVDYPTLDANEDGSPRTLADDRASGARPYLVHICPENVISAACAMVNGKEMLTRLVIRETEVDHVGFAEVHHDRIRVYTADGVNFGHVQIWELEEAPKPGQKEKWRLDEEYDYGLKVIPVVTFYARRDGFMLSKPPFMDLAFQNIAHWQSSSDQRNILTVSRFPMLAVSGASDEESIIRVGPNQVLMTSDSSGKFYYVEHTGAAIEAGRQDLQDLEEQMASYGAEFLKAQPDRNTATSRAMDSAEAQTPLGMMVLSFEGAIAQVFDLMAMWMELGEPGGNVEIDCDAELEGGTQWEVQALQLARQQRDISRKAYLGELQRRRILSQEYDADADEQIIEDETAKGFGPPTGGDLNPLDTAQVDKLEAETDNIKNPPEPTPAPGGPPSGKQPGQQSGKTAPTQSQKKPKGQTPADRARRAGR